MMHRQASDVMATNPRDVRLHTHGRSSSRVLRFVSGGGALIPAARSSMLVCQFHMVQCQHITAFDECCTSKALSKPRDSSVLICRCLGLCSTPQSGKHAWLHSAAEVVLPYLQGLLVKSPHPQQPLSR